MPSATLRLLAYVVVKDQEELTEEEVRDYLLLSLPEYMGLDDLPFTTSGKIDRNAQPTPGNAVSLGSYAYVPPQTPIETQLASLLAALLHTVRVGMDDNFFLVGGNSLLGAQSHREGARHVWLRVVPARTVQPSHG